jgi:hypothetical protein
VKKQRSRQAMLRILLLLEEFSREELREAAALVKNPKVHELYELIGVDRVSSKGSSHSKALEMTRGETVALKEIRMTDPEKYATLRAFENSIREGKVLRTLDQFRSLGTLLGKDFDPGKSRKEAISHLISFLVSKDINYIKTIISKAPAKSEVPNGEGSFRRLANQLISGSQNPKSDE